MKVSTPLLLFFMKTITIDSIELFDSEKMMFYTIPSKTIRIEHSLKAISEWESQFKKPFFSSEKTPYEILTYIGYMIVDGDVNVSELTQEVIDEIIDYWSDSQSALPDEEPDESDNRVLTSEIIYAMMFRAHMDISCEEWNINRLMKTIGVYSKLENPKTVKYTEAEALKRNETVNRGNAELLAKFKKERSEKDDG